MRRHSSFAREGFWLFAALALAAILLARFAGPLWGLSMAVPLVLLLLLFRDPRREIPLAPKAVLAPVDGKVLDVALCRTGLLERQSLRVRIRVNPLGAYSARAPVEGKLLDPYDNAREGSRLTGRGGLWLRTDEGDDVVVTFVGRGFLGVPKAFHRYGERVGHGHRCAFLRLAAICEVYIPDTALPRVVPGEWVQASVDTLAEFKR
ncbi:MAG: hypothetical protein AAGA84_10585 [Pseudomonadota bacterium]